VRGVDGVCTVYRVEAKPWSQMCGANRLPGGGLQCAEFERAETEDRNVGEDQNARGIPKIVAGLKASSLCCSCSWAM